jgi:acyl carrier protein
MSPEEVSQTLKTFLTEEFEGQGNELTEQTNLLEEWFLDSLAIIDVVMFIEERFNIPMERSDINGDNFHSIETLTAFVVAH